MPLPEKCATIVAPKAARKAHHEWMPVTASKNDEVVGIRIRLRTVRRQNI
jgi:hypothetical protein